MTNCAHWVAGQLLSGIIFGRLKEGFVHRNLRGIDFSVAVVDGPAIAYNRGTESRLKSIHWPCIQCQSVFYRSLRHNYYCQQRQVGQGQWAFYFFRCLWICVKAWSVELFSKNLSLWEGGGKEKAATITTPINHVLNTFLAHHFWICIIFILEFAINWAWGY